MSAIPFKPRAAGAGATVAPAIGPAQILEFPVRPYSLSGSDIAALEALASKLADAWAFEVLVDDEGDRWAVFERGDAEGVMFFVGRSGRLLRVFNMDGEPVVTYAQVDALTAMLSDAVGWRAGAQ